MTRRYLAVRALARLAFWSTVVVLAALLTYVYGVWCWSLGGAL